MHGTLLRRPVVAAVLALYALAAGILLPLHAHHGEEGGHGPQVAAVAGDFLDAGCPGGPCEVPGHHHRSAHSHDPATCVKCAAARILAAPVVLEAAPAPVLPAARFPSLPIVAVHGDTPRAAFPARGPPSLS